MNKGTYKNLKGKTTEFNYTDSITLSQTLSFVTEMSGMVVSDMLGYAYMLEEPIFEYCMIKYFTDIKVFENDNDFNLDLLEKFLKDNHDSVIKPLYDNMSDGVIDRLYTACDKAIEFRKLQLSNCREGIAELLQLVRELVNKPDYMNELLIALTNWVKSFDGKPDIDIDMDMISKLADSVSIMKKLDSADVAKTLIGLKDTVKPKTKTKAASKKTKSNTAKSKTNTTTDKVISIEEAKTAADKNTSKEDKQ